MHPSTDDILNQSQRCFLDISQSYFDLLSSIWKPEIWMDIFENFTSAKFQNKTPPSSHCLLIIFQRQGKIQQK